MALLAEELVEEWLNCQGFFTIRGVKCGVHEMDFLAIRPRDNRKLECRQVEVQASVRPVSYITRVPKEVQKATGRSATSARVRMDSELRQGVKEWVEKKYGHPRKLAVRRRLYPGDWSRELVVHEVKHQLELEYLRDAGVTVHRLADIVTQLKTGPRLLDGAAGGSLLDLVALTEGLCRTNA